MAEPRSSKHSMPMLIIDTCSSEDNEDLLKSTSSKPDRHRFSRSFSLPSCGETYKDLAGALHSSPWYYLKHLWTRSTSCPNNSLPYEKSFSRSIALRLDAFLGHPVSRRLVVALFPLRKFFRLVGEWLSCRDRDTRSTLLDCQRSDLELVDEYLRK